MSKSRQAASMIEIVTVVATIAVLLSISLPAIQSSRELARRSACSSNLKQIGLALHSYHNARGRLPAGSIKGYSSMGTGWGWGAKILPHIEGVEVYSAINFDLPTAVGRNAKQVLPTYISTHTCASDHGPSVLAVDGLKTASGNYCGSAGARGELTPGVLYELSDVRFAAITDGLSHTLMVGERVNQPSTPVGSVTSGWFGHLVREDGFRHNSVPHLEVVSFIPVNLSLDYSGCFSSYHPRGANFLMCDGAVGFVGDDIDGDVLQSLGTRAANDTIARSDQRLFR